MMKKRAAYIWICLNLFVSVYSYAAQGGMPSPAEIRQTLNEVYQDVKPNRSGKVANYIPELARYSPNLFGIVVMTVDGQVYAVGDVDTAFAMESISKPFVYTLALKDFGEDELTEKIGLNPTGKPFNSIEAIEDAPDHRQNPLVNAGAIQVTSFIKGKDSEDKWQRVLTYLQELSDGKPYLGEQVYRSEMDTNLRNRSIAALLNAYGMMNGDPDDAVDRYTKACSVMVTAKQLAIMGATFANKGVNPLTHKQVVAPLFVRDALSEMTMSGLYENSGFWWWLVGVPSKSGVGGGILAVVPNKMAIVVYSPPLDEAGNSVRAQEVITKLSARWKLHLLN